MDPLTLPLDYSAIERILPHRFPFLLVDRITELEPDKRIVGIKNVSLNERYLADQPGEMRALPPTILTECVAQVGAILILWKPENYLRGADICANNLEIPMAMADGAVLQMIEESILTPAVIEEAIDQLFNMVQQPSKDGDERANNLQTEIERLEVEITRLTEAIATVGASCAIVAALKEREGRLQKQSLSRSGAGPA